MSLLPTAEISAMQDLQEQAMPNTITFARNGAGASDGMGGRTPTATSHGPYPCRIFRSFKPAVVVAAEAVQVRTDWTITVPVDADVLAGDVGTVAESGQVFAVTAVERGSAWQTAKRLLCEER